MKVIVVLVAFLVVCFAKSVPITFLKQADLSEELLNNPRYLLWQTEKDLIRVEDLQNNNTSNLKLSVNGQNVTFYVYTPENSTNRVKFTETEVDDLSNLTGFSLSRPTFMIVHGWQNDCESPVNQIIKDAVLPNNVNVIVVDWGRIAKENYILAQASVSSIGNYIGDVLLKFKDQLDYSMSQFTIVGHSLGAHIAGNIGSRTGGLVENIIGLDPAGPLFTLFNKEIRLDPNDGKHVHIIHTNAGMLGINFTLGDVDYYPNGGSHQPGCVMDITGSCSHGMSYKYYAESITNNNFVAHRCENYLSFKEGVCGFRTSSNMGGYPVQETLSGKYYLDTNIKPLYAKG